MFPELSSKTAQLLANHNAKLGEMLANWYAHSGVSWTPGVITTPELCGAVESFLPWAEFSRSIRLVARDFLPDDNWVPRLLAPDACDSIIAFWQEIPAWEGEVAVPQSRLLEFLCNCADPPRFGTDVGRYPQQLDALQKLRPAGRLLDLGCGVGHGTMEAAAQLNATSAVGVTLEPLEAWMANNRLLPHIPPQQRPFPPCPAQCEFVAGDILTVPLTGQFDLIICNGLAGGRFLDSTPELQQFLHQLRKYLAPGGVVALANHFHEGRRTGVERLINLAQDSGWNHHGNWQNLFLTIAN